MRVFSEPRKLSLTLPTRRDALAGVLGVCLVPRFSASTPGSQLLRLVATEFPPYTSASLEGDGSAAVITRAALERVGLTMTLQFRPWARALAELQNGQWDGIIGAWYQPDREAYMAFPQPLGITNRIGFLARAGTTLAVGDLSRLGGLKIGVVRDYANPPAFDRANLQRDEALDDLSNLRKLLAGRVDLILIDKGVAFHLLKTQVPEALQAVIWLEPALAESPLYTALSKRDPALKSRLAAFNKGLTELQISGDLARLLKRSVQ